VQHSAFHIVDSDIQLSDATSRYPYIGHLVTTPTDHLIFEITCSRQEYGYSCISSLWLTFTHT